MVSATGNADKKILGGLLAVCLMCTKDVTSFAFTPTAGKRSLLTSTQTSAKRARNSCQNHEDVEMDRRAALLHGAFGMASLSTVASCMTFPQTALAAPTNPVPTWTLENGVVMPILALNTVGLTADESERALTFAVQNGISHVDFHPGKERDGVAQYLAHHQGKSRSTLFLNTKIRKAPPGTSAEDAAERTRTQIADDLKVLNVDQVDMLMLRDSPDCEVIQAQWKVLEEALAAGQTRSLGVINFCEKALTCLLETAKVKPALNYYM